MHPFATACIILVNGIKQRSLSCIHFHRIQERAKCSPSLRQLQRASLTNSPSKRTIHRWYSAFKSGCENLNDDPLAGRPCTSTTIQNICSIIKEEPKQSLRQLAEDIGISKDTVRDILIQQLDKHKVCSCLLYTSPSPRDQA